MRFLPRKAWRKLLFPLPTSPKTLQWNTLRWVCFFCRSSFLSLVTAGWKQRSISFSCGGESHTVLTKLNQREQTGHTPELDHLHTRNRDGDIHLWFLLLGTPAQQWLRNQDNPNTPGIAAHPDMWLTCRKGPGGIKNSHKIWVFCLSAIFLKANLILWRSLDDRCLCS